MRQFWVLRDHGKTGSKHERRERNIKGFKLQCIIIDRVWKRTGEEGVTNCFYSITHQAKHLFFWKIWSNSAVKESHSHAPGAALDRQKMNLSRKLQNTNRFARSKNRLCQLFLYHFGPQAPTRTNRGPRFLEQIRSLAVALDIFLDLHAHILSILPGKSQPEQR